MGSSLSGDEHLARAAGDCTRDHPSEGRAWQLLGVSQLARGRHRDAVANLLRAVALMPDNASIHENLGLVYCHLGDYASADGCMANATRMAPGAFSAWVNWSHSALQLGDPAKAEDCARRALALKPESAAAYLNLGKALAAQSRRVEAEEGFRAALRLQPNWASRMLCGTRAPSDTMLDKAASWRFALEHGLPFAPTIDATDNPEAIAAFAARHGYPLIAKPREGFASRGVFLVLDRRQVENVAGRPDYVLQRYLGNGQSVLSQVARFAEAGVPLFHSFEAVKLSIQVFIAPDGGQTGLFATRNTMRQGRSERIVRDEDPALIRLGARCAQAFAGAGWRGPLNIQCQRTPDGEIGIYEFNGRYTGATAARCLLGYDEVGIGLEAFCGVPRPALPIAVLIEAVRVPLTRAVDPAQVDQLIRNGHWRDAGVDD